MSETLSRKRHLEYNSDFKGDVKKSKLIETKVNDTNLPDGWSIVVLSDSSSAILSPDGRQFQSRLRALQFMIKKRYEKESIEEMRDLLVHEKWRENPLLPEGWKYRNDGDKEIRFIDSQALLISDLEEALNIVKKTGDKADIEGLRMFNDISSIETEETLQGMEEQCSDESEVLMDETVEVDEDDLQVMDEILVIDEQNVSNKSKELSGNKICQQSDDLFIKDEIDTALLPEVKTGLDQLLSLSSKAQSNLNTLKSDFNSENSLPVKKEEITAWEPVETLPAGWMCREMASPDGKGKRIFILSPHGKVFPCRRLALLYMIENEFDDDEVEFMRNMLIHERWETNSLLPQGWKLRNASLNDLKSKEFLSKDCRHFRSFRKALEFLKSSSHFNNKDIANFEEFSSEESKRKREVHYEWVKDESLPKGWKSRTNVGPSGKRFYLSPSGEQFPSRRVILQQMIKEGYSEEEKDAMKITLKTDGWESNSNLPTGWLFRENSGKHKNGISVSVYLLSNEGALFHSYKMAVEFMEESKNYDEEDIKKLNRLINEKTEIRRTMLNDWHEDKNLPQGWKWRIADGKIGKTFFLSPKGEQFFSKRTVLQHMIREEYSEEDLWTMRESLKRDGWESNKNLPKGWLYRETSSKNKGGIHASVMILTVEGYIFKSYKLALDFMRETEGYEGNDYDNIRKLINEKTDIRRTELNNWVNDESLPTDWKMRQSGGKTGKYFFLAPNGKQFGSRKLCLKFMMEKNFPSEQIEEMRKCLIFEGWENSTKLPEKWMFKQSEHKTASGARHRVFLTADGKEIKSFLKALEYLMHNDGFSETDFEGLQVFADEKLMERRIKCDDFVNNESVPPGWKSRMTDGKSGKQYFLSPDGQTFANRRVALMHMIKENFSQVEIETMRNLLKFEGWSDSDNLPDGWMWRQTVSQSQDQSASKAANVQVWILSVEGEMFDSYKTAINFIENNNKYDVEDVENFNDFITENCNKRRQNISDWKEINSLPHGWKTRKGGSLQFFISPDGLQFPNRRIALKYMIDENHPTIDIEKMRHSLKLENWKENSMLPRNWRYKRDKTGDIKYLTNDGEVLSSDKVVRELMETGDEFTHDDKEGLRMFTEVECVRRRSSNYNWNVGDTTVPEGWKSRNQGDRKYFLSPDGQQFPCRRGALQHMLKSEFEKEEIEEMRNMLQYEGWEVSKHLPQGWLQKINQKGLHNNVQLLSLEGNMLESYKTAIEFMESLSHYNETDLLGIQMLMEEKASERRLSMSHWKDGNSVPRGWKIRVAGGKTNKEFFLAPDGKQFPCRKAGLQHMILENYPSEEIEDMRRMLRFEGWEINKHLPKGWRMRYSFIRVDCSNMSILSLEGKEFKAYKPAIEFMESNPMYTVSDINDMRLLIEEKSSVRRQSIENGWNDDETVPNGWKVRISNGKAESGKKFFLSPSGRQFPCRKAALQFMIKEKFPVEDVEEMRVMLRLEDWKINEYIPEGWLIKYSYSKVSSTNLAILSIEGLEFKSYSTAIGFMESDSRYTQTDVEKLKFLIEEQCTERRQSIKDWIKDETVPEGWKVRVAHGKAEAGKQFFLSPEGKQYPCRKAALQFMIKENYSEDQIEEMRNVLNYEGWEESKYLPAKWMLRINIKKTSMTQSIVFLTVEGSEFKSYSTAIDHLLFDSKYTEEDVENIRILMDQHSTLRRTSNDQWEENESVPEGWKVKVSDGKANSGKQFFLAPDGRQFPCRRLAMKTMIEEVFPQEDIDDMRGKLVYEGWETSDDLPRFWYMKRPSNPKDYALAFITDVGEKLSSTKSAIEYLQTRNKDNIEEIDKLINLSKNCKTIKSEGHEWEEDDTIPEGWRVRRVPTNKPGAPELEIFLTNGGQQIFHRKSAIDHAIRENLNYATINNLRKGMKRYGWETELNLPHGFLKRTSPNGKNTTEFLTPDNQKFESNSKFLEHLLSLGTYGNDVIGYVAQGINWSKLSRVRKNQLQDLMNERIKEERDQHDFEQESNIFTLNEFKSQ